MDKRTDCRFDQVFGDTEFMAAHGIPVEFIPALRAILGNQYVAYYYTDSRTGQKRWHMYETICNSFTYHMRPQPEWLARNFAHVVAVMNVHNGYASPLPKMNGLDMVHFMQREAIHAAIFIACDALNAAE